MKQVNVFISYLNLSMKPKSQDSTHTKLFHRPLERLFNTRRAVPGREQFLWAEPGSVHHVRLTRAGAGAGVLEMGRGDEEAVAGGACFCFKLHPFLYSLVLAPMASQVEWDCLRPSRCVPSHQVDVHPAECSWGG